MTAQEKITEIERLLSISLKTSKEADRICELRDGLKVSDLFKAKGQYDISADWAMKILGFEVILGGQKRCDKLEAAVAYGYIKPYQLRRYGQFRMYYTLTEKAKALLK